MSLDNHRGGKQIDANAVSRRLLRACHGGIMKVYPHLVICPYCDSLYRYRTLGAGESASCERCHAVLYRAGRLNIERMLAMTLTALIAFFIANLCPVMTASFHAVQNSATLWQASWALAQGSTLPMAIGMLFLLIIIPFLQITLFGWLLIYARLGLRAPGFTGAMKWLLWLRPWNMIEVGMLGFLVSAIKLSSFVQIIPGAGCWAMAVLMLLITLLNHQDIRALWTLIPWATDDETASHE